MSGQRCSACSRVVATTRVHDALVERLGEAADALVVGDIADVSTYNGPLISPHVVETFESIVAAAREDGAAVAGGTTFGPGNYVRPTVISGLPIGHRLTREELFMPVITVTKVSDFEAAVEEANATHLGLTAGIFTGSQEEAKAYLDRAEAGCVDVNVPGAATTGWWPGRQTFGGWRGSGSTGKQASIGRWYVQLFARERCGVLAAASRSRSTRCKSQSRLFSLVMGGFSADG